MIDLRRIIIFLTCTVFATAVHAALPTSHTSSGAPKGVKNVTSGCTRGGTKLFVDLNNVKAVIKTHGGMWQDGNASYEVPKGSGKHSVFAGGIWVAGVDVNGQLRVAARIFDYDGQDDYWPGPLISKGDNMSNVTVDVCIQYDKIWKVDRDMVSQFISWYNLPAEEREKEFPGYSPPLVLQEWPGNGPDFGTEGEEYDRYLAPYADVDGNGRYNIDGGDYPNYEFQATSRCKFVPERRADSLNNSSVTLYGDQTLWWVYNDKGNIHTQSKGAAIGMEIRAQAFAFSSNDELNNMTFYNYQLINRSTYSLNNAFFGVWVDADLGDPTDDLVGCDINRGLSFAYNGGPDGNGSGNTYGKNPPAVGFDFFEGPYQDPNDMDDVSNWPGLGEVEPDCQNGYIDSLDVDGEIVGRIKVSNFDIFNGNINGLNFGDRIVDNERWGMRRFVYFINGGPDGMDDPDEAMDYYNYLRGIWKDGETMTYGGNGKGGTLPANFLFPWKSDKCNWGTGGIDPNDDEGWRQEAPSDGRLLQSAGPFVLRPGATNYITIGVPWARTSSEDPLHSVELLKLADDKCQKLFENCFRMIEGPHAPELTAVELDRKFIMHLDNPPASNNYLEKYKETDPFITHNFSDRDYVFEGYQVFQLKHKDITVNQIYDENVSKLVYQCDIENNASMLVNYTWDPHANANSFQVMVNGANSGIKHTFEVTRDEFTKEQLVNYKKYYYIAISYAYNNYKTYNQNLPETFDGQKTPYLASRKSTVGEIKNYEFVPRPGDIGMAGMLNSDYGDIPPMSYLSGRGNSMNRLQLSDETIDEIMNSANSPTPWKAEVRKYAKNGGPARVIVIDPLNVKPGNFDLFLEPDSVNTGGVPFVDYILVAGVAQNTDNNGLILGTKWTLVHNGVDTLHGPVWMRHGYEYILPEYGIAIDLYQSQYPVTVVSSMRNLKRIKNGFLGASITYNNPAMPWYNGLADAEGPVYYNWIRSGTFDAKPFEDVPGDAEQDYEKVLGGTWAPYKFVSSSEYGPGNPDKKPQTINYNQYRLPSIEFVITKDTSKWTRCIVIETCENTYDNNGIVVYPNPISEGGATKFMLRHAPSLNKLGVAADSMTMDPSDNPSDPNFISAYGMSWFPGYAIDVETGERLNIAFGEDSYLVGQKGRDMIWNPTNSFSSIDGIPQFGGKHFIYVFGTGYANIIDGSLKIRNFPRYDEGRLLFSLFHKRSNEATINNAKNRIAQAMLNVSWVNIPMISRRYQWESYSQMPDNDVRISIGIGNPYHRNIGVYQDPIHDAINKGYPYFSFSLDELAPKKFTEKQADESLERIGVVPNPYFAHNAYEVTQLDNIVKIINLPPTCSIKIFNLSGTLIRSFEKSSEQTWIDWNLTNTSDVPISGGAYIIHVSVPNVGEKIIKWFGVLRPADLSNF